MACGCRKNNNSNSEIAIEPILTSSSSPVSTDTEPETAARVVDDITVEPIVVPTSTVKPPPGPVAGDNTLPVNTSNKHVNTLQDAAEIGLEQCYLCAKKHVERAKDFFEEYHTKYPSHIKNLIESARVAEIDVRRAFLVWQRIMGQMNMGEGELLGKDLNALTMRKEHIDLANKIREERIKLSDDPLYSPDFDTLLVEIHLLQHKVLDNG